MHTNSSEAWLGRVTDAQVMDVIAAAARRGGGVGTRPDRTTWINRAVVAGLTLAGLACPQGALVWYEALVVGFIGIAGGVLGCAALIAWASARQTQRLQGPRRKPAPIAREIRGTLVSAWVAACLLAWPLARVWSDEPIGLVWTLAEAGGGPAIFLQTFAAVLAIDAWLYWKHRLLHTRLLFPFHREHHSFRDPTSFAGFAVGPVEALLTFWPIVFLALPEAIHYAPLYFSLVAGFILLNLYLHCGVAVRAIEATLPRLYFNTSAFHNRHHANAEVNFAEAFTIWDHLCRTREQDLRRPNRRQP